MKLDEPGEGIIISERRWCSHQRMPINYYEGTIGWCPGCGHYVVWRQQEWRRLTLLDLDLWFRVLKARGKI